MKRDIENDPIVQKILVVEDSKDLNRVICEILQEEGYETGSAISGSGAIAWAKENPDGIMLLDYMLPDMNGREVIEALEKHNIPIPFIIMTAHGNEKVAVDMMKMGARDYLMKSSGFLDILPSIVEKITLDIHSRRKLEQAERELQERREKDNIIRLERAEADLQESRYGYQQLFESSPEPIVILGLDGIIKDCNHKMTELAGLTKEKMLNKMSLDMGTIPDEDVEKYIEMFSRLMSREKVDPLEIRIKPPGKEMRWFEIHPAMLEKDGEAVAIQIINRDITLRKQAEERKSQLLDEVEKANKDLADANIRLKEADQLKSEFVSILAHDLGTPMAILKSNIELFIMGAFGNVSEEQSGKLERMMRGANRLNRLREDTLDLCRMDLGTMELDTKSVELSDLITDAVEDIRYLSDEKNQEVSMELPDLDAVSCDPGKIRQVLDNFLSNAVRYTGEDGDIHVGAMQDDSEITVWIRDTGRGLPQEELAKVFGRFYRTGKRVKGSTGLGLAIVKGIIETHGGRAWCESEGEGKGSTFYFSLPLTT